MFLFGNLRVVFDVLSIFSPISQKNGTLFRFSSRYFLKTLLFRVVLSVHKF